MIAKRAITKLMLLMVFFLLFLCNIGILLFSEIPEKIIIGYNESYPPYVFIEDRGKATGIYPEIIDAAAKLVGIEIEYQQLVWARIKQEAKKGNIDAVMGLSKTSDRIDCFDFLGEGLIYEEYSFFTLKDSGIKYSGKLDELKDITIGVVQDYKYGYNFDQAAFLKIEKCLTDKNVLEKLVKKRFPIAIGNKMVIAYYAKQLDVQEQMVWLDPPVSRGYSHIIAFSKTENKSYGELSRKFADAINILMNNGKVLQILNKYSFENKELTAIKLAYNDWSPYHSPDMPNQGPIAEIVKQAFKRVGYNAKLEFFPLANLMEKLKSGRYDAGFAAYYSKQRAKEYVFSDPIGICSRVAFLKKKTTKIRFTKLEDLEPYRIGVTRGYIYAVPEFDNAKFLNKIESASEEASILNLLKGRLDLVIIDKVVAQYLIDKKFRANIDEFDYLEFTNEKGELYLFISETNKEAERIKKDFDYGLKLIKEDGTFDRIIKNYKYNYEKNKI